MLPKTPLDKADKRTKKSIVAFSGHRPIAKRTYNNERAKKQQTRFQITLLHPRTYTDIPCDRPWFELLCSPLRGCENG